MLLVIHGTTEETKANQAVNSTSNCFLLLERDSNTRDFCISQGNHSFIRTIVSWRLHFCFR
ncbi:hypothetical protein MKX03_010042, partial [Papaver bracteatum]